MRADQPVSAAAAPTVSGSCIAQTLSQSCQGWFGSPPRGANAPTEIVAVPVCRVGDAPVPKGELLDLPESACGRCAAGDAVLRRRGAFAAVGVFEADDVVQLRRRHLEDRRVLERGHAVHRARREVEGGAGADDLFHEDALARVPELELGSAGLDEPRLVLLAVEL